MGSSSISPGKAIERCTAPGLHRPEKARESPALRQHQAVNRYLCFKLMQPLCHGLLLPKPAHSACWLRARLQDT